MTITIKKGEEANRLSVLRDLAEPLLEYFETVKDDSDEFKKFFGGTKTIATKAFKVTLIIEEL